MNTSQLLDLAIAHYRGGRSDLAGQICRQILAVQPHPEAIHVQAVISNDAGQTDAAMDFIRQAIALDTANWAYHNTLGLVLLKGNRPDQAVAAHRRALQLRPDYVEAHYNLGNALNALGQRDDAIEAYRAALRLKFEYTSAHNNLGLTLAALGRLDEAIAELRIAVQLRPDLAELHCNLGFVLKDCGRLDEAADCFRRALALAPALPAVHSNLLCLLHFLPGQDARSIFEEHQRWRRQHADPLKASLQPHLNDRSAERRLRIGYVSPDFREHVIGLNVLPLLSRHDSSHFELFCYSDVAQPDALTGRFRQCANFRDIAGQRDDAVAQRIRADRIDILVDLTLHLVGNRLLVFARKPAPVQVTFAGYPGTTGLDAIDYRLTDPHLDPPGLFDAFCSERSIRLPDSFWCYEPLSDEPAPSGLPARSTGVITFGCLNNFCKVNPAVLRLWARVMRSVADSRLLLLSGEGWHRDKTRRLLATEGVEPERVRFVPIQPRPAYLKVFHDIDLSLDTFPYNGHTTSLDSFWMGVPVVTLVGNTIVGRAGLSQSMNLGLPDLVAHTPDEFARLAVDLAGNLDRLQSLRSTLRQRMRMSPVMGAPRFARNIEAAYREMWRAWCTLPGA